MSSLTSTRPVCQRQGQSIPSISAVLLCTLLFFSSILSASAYQLEGCYSSSGSLTFKNTDSVGQTSKTCYATCEGKKYMGLTEGNQCWCGDSAPSSSDKINTSSCNLQCPGYRERCGGTSVFFVFLRGSSQYPDSDLSYIAGSDSSSSLVSTSSTASSTQKTSSSNTITSNLSNTINSIASQSSRFTTSSPSTDTSSSSSSSTQASSSGELGYTLRTSTTGGVTVVITATVTNGPSSSSSSGANNDNNSSDKVPEKNSGSSVSGGTIAGAVIGAIAGLALIAGLVFFLLRRRAQNRYDREASSPHGIPDPFGDDVDNKMNAFGVGGVGDGNDGFMSIDQRLNPVMLNRRLSEGSLADDQDYSRKILRVANPED
ncbi:hypothetical protein NADFUDRAFT_83116 [Nadsonia fulvescens var. elongata DSM 6958]|uniref:WSC domain-containing protein n=1 Tax=Nadsonia fulvescens var. elongata DSM 6958 TaxID=857566 RepID=A0A1E3PIG3_9ASCO|nr:hypothetical protein NADFUDRAFT_83116 [Nadsonia fulvescens var. elongata DSM 6958]